MNVTAIGGGGEEEGAGGQTISPLEGPGTHSFRPRAHSLSLTQDLGHAHTHTHLPGTVSESLHLIHTTKAGGRVTLTETNGDCGNWEQALHHFA